MNKSILEQIRIIIVSGLSLLAGVFSDTKQFLIALIIAFSWNVWAGMRADGISIIKCKNFSFSKFWVALGELLMYFCLIYSIQNIMFGLGDKEAGLIVMKTMTYIICYVYMQNGLKNALRSYPKNKALRILYHVVRFEFTKALPSRVKEIIERIEKEDEFKKNQNDTEN